MEPLTAFVLGLFIGALVGMAGAAILSHDAVSEERAERMEPRA